MAAPVIASSTVTVSFSSETINATKPSGTTGGDLLVALVFSAPGATFIQPAPGWTSVRSATVDGVTNYSVSWKAAGDSEPSTYAFTSLGAGDEMSAILLRITGADVVTPVDVLAVATGTDDTLAFSSVTTTLNDELVLLLGSVANTAPDPTGSQWPNLAPSGTTVDTSKINSLSGYNNVAGIAYFTQSTAGATGSKTVALQDHAPSTWYAFTLAIRAARTSDPGPIFIRQGQVDIGSGYLTTANTTPDLTSGTIYLAFTADVTEGGFLEYIKCKSSPAGNNVQTVARVWLNNGSATGTASNNILLGEVTLPATTASSTAQVGDQRIGMNMALLPGYRVYITIATTVANGWNFTGVGGRY